MSEFSYLKKEFFIEVMDVDTSDFSLYAAEKLEEEVAKKERLMREQLSFLESMGDVILSYERDSILVEIISENAEQISNKVHHITVSYENSIAKLLVAYKCYMELEEMLA